MIYCIETAEHCSSIAENRDPRDLFWKCRRGCQQDEGRPDHKGCNNKTDHQLITGFVEGHLEFLEIGVYHLKFKRPGRKSPERQVKVTGHIKQGISSFQK